MKSFLGPIARLQGAERERKEAETEAWIEKMAEEMYPEAERAGRMTREVAGLYLERKALEALRERNPMQMRAIPIPESVEEAVELAASEVMYASREEREAAMGMLLLMEQGALKP